MNLSEAKEFVKYHFDYVGGHAFHPDTDFNEYVDAARGCNLYSEASALEANEKMAIAMQSFDDAGEDIYEFCLNML